MGVALILNRFGAIGFKILQQHLQEQMKSSEVVAVLRIEDIHSQLLTNL